MPLLLQILLSQGFFFFFGAFEVLNCTILVQTLLFQLICAFGLSIHPTNDWLLKLSLVQSSVMFHQKHMHLEVPCNVYFCPVSQFVLFLMYNNLYLSYSV